MKKSDYRANVKDYLGEFAQALSKQLEEDTKRWGDTWKERPIEGQEIRTKLIIDNYFDQYTNANVPIPWLKIAGNAYICWLREYQQSKNKEKQNDKNIEKTL